MILLTLNPDVRPSETQDVAEKITKSTGLIAKPDPLKPVRRILIDTEPDDVEALADRIRREFPQVSRVIHVRALRIKSEYRLEDVVEDVSKLDINIDGTFAVEARRLDKDLPFTSKDVEVRVGDAVRKTTGASVDLENPDYYVDVHLSGNGYLVGVTPTTVREPRREWLPHDAFSDVYVCFERPETEYEIADMIRVVAALRLGGLILVEPDRNALEKALSKVGAASTVDVEVEDDLKEALRGRTVALHPTAPRSEDALLSVARDAEELTLLVGSEREGLSERARSAADMEVHLGPTSAEPMRSSNAVAYAVGVLSHLVR